jgi:hypothetical protein
MFGVPISRKARSGASPRQMLGDPQEFEQVRLCAEWARTAASPEAREQSSSLQKSWGRLAAEIESDQSLLEIIDRIRLELSDSVLSGDQIPPRVEVGQEQFTLPQV